ncbi:Uma2 family endonuclease [Leptolyngbya sp. DQ-M1]|uniref:Uma2 family endonuclease n=1 Tax=Leptolyngbya sp. DQ-M1 TaxID=2933920 RepID=UPI003297D0CC
MNQPITDRMRWTIADLELPPEDDRRYEIIDRELKLRFYSARGVREYWIIDWQAQQMEVYRRESATLALAATLFPGDEITSAMLPGFRMPIVVLFT